jgi:uncharacterized protein
LWHARRRARIGSSLYNTGVLRRTGLHSHWQKRLLPYCEAPSRGERLSRRARFAIGLAAIVFTYAMLGNVVDRFIYYPMRYPQGAWELQAKAGAEDRWLTASDGTRLNAWWFPKADARFATVFLHGNGGNLTHRIDHAQAVLDAGSAFLVVDYRGYGKSQGQPSERGLYQDADAAYSELLHLGYGPERIVIQGESLGTAVAADLAMRKQCAGVILESPLMSAGRMAGKVLPFFGPLVVRGYDTYSKISRVHAPLMVIHGDADEIVPFSQGKAVFDAANRPKQFWTVSGAHHNDLLEVAGAKYVAHLRAFYQQLRSK